MTSKIFNKKADAICKKYNCEKIGDSRYKIKTLWGDLFITLSPSPRIKLYSIFMRFENSEKFDLSQFKKCFSVYEGINTHSKKWNIHYQDPYYALDLLEDRIDNLNWLDKKSNLETVINQYTLKSWKT